MVARDPLVWVDSPKKYILGKRPTPDPIEIHNIAERNKIIDQKLRNKTIFVMIRGTVTRKVITRQNQRVQTEVIVLMFFVICTRSIAERNRDDCEH